MRHTGNASDTGAGQTRPIETRLALEELARTLDQASLNMSVLSLDAVMETAANANSPLDAADAAGDVAGRLARQMRELEAAISEVVRSTEG